MYEDDAEGNKRPSRSGDSIMTSKQRPVRVTMNERGRVTLPIEARRALRLEPGADLEAEVIDGKLVLTPAILVPREDAWAYAPEHRALVEQAREDARAGRVYHLGRADLEQLIAGTDDPE